MDKEVKKQTALMKKTIKERLGIYKDMISVTSTNGYDYTVSVNGNIYANYLNTLDAWDIIEALCKGFETGMKACEGRGYHNYPVSFTETDVKAYLKTHSMDKNTVKGIRVLHDNLSKMDKNYDAFCKNCKLGETEDISDQLDSISSIVYDLCKGVPKTYKLHAENAAEYISTMLHNISKEWMDAMFISCSHFHEFELAVESLYKLTKYK